MTSTTLPTATSWPFKRLTTEEMAAGLYFNYNEPFTQGHKCKHLFDITAVNNYTSDNDNDNSLMMLVVTQGPGVRGGRTMCLAGAVLGTGAFILIDTGATHNVIDINFARVVNLREQRINTTIILVGSGNEVSCRAASFTVPLCIDSESFQVDTFLLDITNDVDIILGMPWLVDLGRVTWDLSKLEMQFQHAGHVVTFTGIHPRRQAQTVVALPAPPPITPAPRQVQ